MNQSKTCQFWSKLGLSLLTTPFIFALLALQSLIQSLIEWGEASEEIFRGDRLPILNFPEGDREEEES